MITKQENSKLKHISIKSIIHVFILKFETPFVDHAMTATKNTRDRSISFSTTVIVIATIATAATIAQASTSLCPLIYGSHHRRSSFFIFFLISLSLSLSKPSLSLLTSHHGQICIVATTNVNGFYLFPSPQINPQSSQSNLNLTLYHLF